MPVDKKVFSGEFYDLAYPFDQKSFKSSAAAAAVSDRAERNLAAERRTL